ncbi:MAG: hypothetical protein M1140_15580 [Chloroflexi bacterium]|nr:hypothetical protein [Chloroflexota bacterium]
MSTGASIALIFLIIETMFVAIVFLALFGAMVFGMHKLRGLLKRYFPKAQQFTRQVYTVTRQISDKVAAPFVWVNGAAANAQATAKGAWRRVNRNVSS